MKTQTKTTYEMILISPDGLDHVRDFESDSISECSEAWGDSGSRWFFYPIGCIIETADSSVLDSKIVSIPCYGTLGWVRDNFPDLTVREFKQYISENSEEIQAEYQF